MSQHGGQRLRTGLDHAPRAGGLQCVTVGAIKNDRVEGIPVDRLGHRSRDQSQTGDGGLPVLLGEDQQRGLVATRRRAVDLVHHSVFVVASCAGQKRSAHVSGQRFHGQVSDTLAGSGGGDRLFGAGRIRLRRIRDVDPVEVLPISHEDLAAAQSDTRCFSEIIEHDLRVLGGWVDRWIVSGTALCDESVTPLNRLIVAGPDRSQELETATTSPTLPSTLALATSRLSLH